MNICSILSGTHRTYTYLQKNEESQNTSGSRQVLQKPSHQHYKGIMAVKIASKFHARGIRGL